MSHLHDPLPAVRPRRSVLFVPGSNGRAIEKARSLPADALILDLEDAVAPEAKAHARTTVETVLLGHGYGEREVVVRVNGADTAWYREDLAAVARTRADALLLPKVESPAAIHDAISILDAHDAPGSLAVWCMIETPGGVLNAPAIAAASPRVAALVMGTSDLTKDLRARHTRDRSPLVTSLGLCVLGARAAGVAALDGVHLDLNDDAGFEAACRQARDFGFDGKTLIHPKTIAMANEIFAPTPAEVDAARRVIAAHAAATAEGRGVVVLDGRLIENLHVEESRHLIALAEAIDALDRRAMSGGSHALHDDRR